VLRALDWTGPSFKVSSLAHSGLNELVNAVMDRLDQLDAAEQGVDAD
jgi:hypothetical protein